MDKEEICAMLGTLASVLNNLKLLRVKTSQEELESLVTRAFLEGNLDYRKGMTTYEVITGCRERYVILGLHSSLYVLLQRVYAVSSDDSTLICTSRKACTHLLHYR